MKIAVIAEIAPAKAFVPVLEKLDAEVIGLTHGQGADELLKKFCTEMHYIGESRGRGAEKRSKAKIASLVFEDIISTIKVLRGKNIDLLLTCGNAGDVRKGISAAKFLRIPDLHIEQDFYNPIEMIAFSNLITVPSKHYKEFLAQNYEIYNSTVIGGYPMASYVNQRELKDVNLVKSENSIEDFFLLVLGGDVQGKDIPEIIKTVENLDKTVLIVPFRFDAQYVKSLVKSPKIKVLNGFVDLLSFMNASSGMIYGAGMGLTIEAGVLGVPSIKLAGFHRQHASVDLANELGIPVVEIQEIPEYINNLRAPRGKWLIGEGEKSVSNIITLINNFEGLKGKSSGIKSFRKIWDARSKFR
jgi:UDP-N-acetylglucosamine:LPS N-acetylglucosamine transferase